MAGRRAGLRVRSGSLPRGAERLGVDLTAPPLAVRGPQELRTTIQAFNRMQDRLQRFLEDRTQMLAAISHDLRAPLARLRLRAELVDDGEQQRKMFDDLDVMNAMIDSTLAFARDDSAPGAATVGRSRRSRRRCLRRRRRCRRQGLLSRPARRRRSLPTEPGSSRCREPH